MTSFRRIGLALVAVAALMMPLAASAATSGTATQSATLQGGALSISTPDSSTTFPSTAISLGTLAGAVNAADYSDATATGNGWSATVAVQQFHFVPTWSTVAPAGQLLDQTSQQYTGNTANGIYTVKVLATSTGSAGVNFAVSGEEVVATYPGVRGVPTAVGSRGATITFMANIAYAYNDTYILKVGNLPTTALALNSALTTVTPTTSAPAAVGATSTITSGSAIAVGSPVKFVSAAVGQGIGTFHITPGFTLTWVPGSTWAAAYTAQAQYSITSGP